MAQEISSALTGLSQGLTKYMDMGNEFQLQNAQAQQKNQAALNLKSAESQLDLNKTNQENKYKTTLEDVLTPDMAEKVLPGAGAQMIQSYNQQNPNRPLKLKDGIDYLKSAADALNPDTAPAAKQQDKLEKEYADRLGKVVNARTGGLGLQDSKVNQAVDLRTLINQYYDPKTKEYTIPPSQHSELALGLARLLSPQGTVPIELEKQLRQSTGREALAKSLIYMGADPAQVGGSTQSVIKMFVDSVDRQGQTAERIRNQYMSGLKDLKPTSLSQDRADRLNKAQLTSSFNDLLSKSPDHQAVMADHSVGRVAVIGPDGKTRGTIPAGQLQEALKNGYKQAE